MTPRERDGILEVVPYNDTNSLGCLMVTPLKHLEGVVASAKHIDGKLVLILRGYQVDNFEDLADTEAKSFGHPHRILYIEGRTDGVDYEEAHYIAGD